MRPDVLSRRPLVALGAAAVCVLLAPSAAGAAQTIRFEAENYAPTGGAGWVQRSADASGGKLRWLNANGRLEIPVDTSVASFTVRVKGTRCVDPTETGGTGMPVYQLRTYPGYFQQDPYVDPDPAVYGTKVRTWSTSTEWTTWTFLLPFGYQAPGPLTGGEPNRLQLRFLNDFKSGPDCDRNLAVDYFEVATRD